MRQDPYQYFRPEARKLLEQLNHGVLELERGGTDSIPRLLRLAHTLKGAARVVRHGAIADHAHAIEDALAAVRDRPVGLRSDRIDSLLTTLDAIAGLVSALTPPAPPQSVGPADSAADDSFKTIRADVTEMDALLDGVTESHVQLNALRRAVASIDRGSCLADLLVEQLAPRPGGERSSMIGSADVTAGQLRHLFAGIERQVRAGIDQLERELGQVREAAEQLRLIPAGAIFTSLERTVHDAARALGKAARF